MSLRIYGLMLGTIIILLSLYLAPVGKQFVDTAMNVSSENSIGLDCDNSSISNFDKGTCVVTDFGMFYFFGGLILIGGAVIVAKIIF